MIVKIVIALLIGFLLGLEREKANKPAGLRDIILVILGTVLFTLLNDPDNRMIANLITGIGFLGGGVILKNSDHIEGVTTATVLWIAVALGIAIGLGKLTLALIIGLTSIIVLHVGIILKFLGVEL